MAGPAVASSFRDPSGFIFEEGGVLKRQVNDVYRADYDHLMSSGLYDALTKDGLLVAHLEEDTSARPGAHKVIVPERVPFVSYPYEWCFGQYKAAALATLEIQSRAMDHGMSLRDSSAYNIQWLNAKPALIDTLSFERLEVGVPWIAYRQFCQHFLAPLALMSTVDVRLAQLMRVHLDGVPLDLASRLLPGGIRRPSLQIHIHSHAKSQQRHSSAQKKREDVKGRFSERAFRGLIESLRSAVDGMTWEPEGRHWLNYYEGDSYTEAASAAKERLVRTYLADVRPTTVWDLGANTGRFSRIAAETGAFTVSFELDPEAVEANYRDVTERGLEKILPLVLDLANPSPPLGWANAERSTIAERGPADVALALALIHHIAIGNNVPLARIAEEFARLAHALIIEFVPKNDAKVQVLLGSRDDIFAEYHQEGFERAFRGWFAIERSDRIEGSERVLYSMRRL